MGKNKVGSSVKKNSLSFWSKMYVLCMLYVYCEFGGLKKLKGRDFFE